jgi:hypothetical protein
MDNLPSGSNKPAKLYHRNNLNRAGFSCAVARSPRFQALLTKSRRSIAAGKGLTRNEFWKAVKQRHNKPTA